MHDISKWNHLISYGKKHTNKYKCKKYTHASISQLKHVMIYIEKKTVLFLLTYRCSLHSIIDNNTTVLQSISVSHTYYIIFTYSSKNTYTRVPLHISDCIGPALIGLGRACDGNRCWNEQDCRMDLLGCAQWCITEGKSL